jgi:hypothetical protein
MQLQRSLWCPCGSGAIHARGLCRTCYEDWRRDEAHFDGLRDQALARDGACLVCAEWDLTKLIVHHRRPGFNRLAWLATLCRRHHNQVHHVRRIRYGMDARLRQFWLEAHRGQPLQLELALVEIRAEFRQARLFEAA